MNIINHKLVSVAVVNLLFTTTSFALHVSDTVSNENNLAASKLRRSFPSLVREEIPRAHIFNIQNRIDQPTEAEKTDREKIDEAVSSVKSSGRIISKIQPTEDLDFPVGLEVNLGFLNYLLVVDSIVGVENEADVFASMRFEVPQSGRSIYFKSSAVRMDLNGNILGEPKLFLIGDYIIPLDSANTQLIIKDDEERTYVMFDCKGYKEMSLNASLVFSNSLLVPEDEKGVTNPNGNVSIDFTTVFTDWNDIVVEVNVPRFQLTGLKDVSFSVTGAVLDFSDLRNPLGISFPPNYQSQMPGGIWTGVFIRNATITLPPQFDKKDNSGRTNAERISITGTNLILDNVGLTGKVGVRNLIPIDKGRLGKWAYSIDEFFIDVVSNSIRDGGFSGKIQLPLTQSQVASQKDTVVQSLLSYSALIRDGEYLFNVSVENQLEFNFWKATVKLDPNSYIEVNVVDDEFVPRAVLNGMMTLNVGLKESVEQKPDNNKNAYIPDIHFQNLVIQSVKPYVTVQALSLGAENTEPKLGGFHLSVSDIEAQSTESSVSLGLSVKLNLIGKSGNAFGADGRIKIVSEVIENDSDVSYRFKKIQIEEFGIDVDKGAFGFHGQLVFFKEDATYGNGIAGKVKARFKPGIEMESDALFGTKDGLHYWYVDGLIKFNNGLTLFSGIAAYSFGGGAYYHMRIDDRPVSSSMRKVSPIAYIPDANSSLGLKASVGLGIQPGKQAFNGDFIFEMAFNNSGGVRYINFKGNGYFLTPPLSEDIAKLQEKTKRLATAIRAMGVSTGNLNEGSVDRTAQIHGTPAEQNSRAALWASTTINYDFENHVLHGNLVVYVNVAGGLIKGPGPGGRAGEAVMHFAPGEWYVYVGRPEPENRVAITVAGLARLDSYFLMGSHIPDSPPPPAEVSNILGNLDLNYMKDLNALSDGAGVGFGSSFGFNTGDITFLIFYGRFAAGLGVDAMLKDYGNVSCQGSGPLGINGWYANTQAYAFFEGSIGIKVKVFGVRKKVPILELGAAVVAQAKLPNPVWIKGVAGGKYNVLGGLVKGSCRFEIEIGHECEIIRNASPESALEGLEILSQVTPSANATEVDVFTVPQAVFNYEVEKPYTITGENDLPVTFKISLDGFVIKDGNAIVTSDLTWNADKTVVALNPFEILPSQKNLTLEVVTSFKEQKNGAWIVALVDGQPLMQRTVVPFRTGTAPDYIPASNVAYSYPLQNQYNYYKDEFHDGYITLKRGQSYLFETPGWHPVIRVSANGSAPIELPAEYRSAEKELHTPLPANLSNDKIYKLSIVNVPGTQRLTSIDQNVQASTVTALDDIAATAEVRRKSATGTIKEEQEKEIYSTYFRTSKFNTLSQKLQNAQLSTGWRIPILPVVHQIGSNFGGQELFSLSEILGESALDPLVQVEADLSNNAWFSNDIYPLIYEGYPLYESMRISRDPGVYGVVPTRAVSLYQLPHQIFLDPSVGAVLPDWRGRFDYDLTSYMYNDFHDLSNAAAVLLSRYNNPRLTQLVTGSFPKIKRGDYWIQINYILPGKRIKTSTYRHNIRNEFD